MRAPTAGWAALAVVPLAVVGFALVMQHGYDHLPCPWCVFQRLVFVAIAVVAIVALAWRARAPRRALAVLVVALAAVGVAAAAWQHRVVASGVSCTFTLADRVLAATGLDQALPDVFAAWASCADAALRLLGVPYEVYSGALFAASAAVAIGLLRRPA